MQEEKSTKFIVDASMVLAFLLPDEKHIKAVEIFDQYTSGKIKLIAPNLLPYEIINGLKGAILRKRVSFPTAVKLIEEFLDLTIPMSEIELTEVLEVSIAKEISVYDASYIYLSKKEKLPLLTLDEKLKKC